MSSFDSAPFQRAVESYVLQTFKSGLASSRAAPSQGPEQRKARLKAHEQLLELSAYLSDVARPEDLDQEELTDVQRHVLNQAIEDGKQLEALIAALLSHDEAQLAGTAIALFAPMFGRLMLLELKVSLLEEDG